MGYIIFAIIIVVLVTIAGIDMVSDANKKLKKCYKGTVVKCEECESPYEISVKQYYEVSFEINSPDGIIQRSTTTNKFYNVGSVHDVYCDGDTTEVEDIASIKKNRNNGLLAFMPATIGVFVGIGWLLNRKYGPEITFIILGTVIVILGFIYVIVSVSGITKNKKRYNDLDVYRVNGKVVKHIRHGKSYTSLYEFYDNGVRRTIESSIDDGERLSVRRSIGSDVVIVINRKTKEAYCEEDMRSQKQANIFAIAMLIIVIVSVLSVFIK